jgi:hypothetical protein
LVAGLFHSRIAPAGIALVDEAELGLEPHRIARFLRLLGAGSDTGPQVFLTTHSPVVVRELRAQELAIAHRDPVFGVHEINNVADVHTELDIQALVRANAESFLAAAVVVAEGATEIGLVRGLDHYWVSQGQDPLAMAGISIANGGGIPQAASRATAYAKLGYRTILFMDDDRPLTDAEREPVEEAGAIVISWGAGHATEQALFHGLSWPSVLLMLNIAAEIWDTAHLETCVRAVSNGDHSFDACRAQDLPGHRDILALAAKQHGWFKRIDFGERVGQEVIGPGRANATAGLQAIITEIYERTRSGQNG